MDLDLFDDILGEKATKNVRAGGKFQPKAKPRQVKKNLGATSISNSQPVPTVDVTDSVFNASSGKEKAASSDDNRSFGVAPSDHIPSTENVNSSVAVDGCMPDSNDNWHSSFENPMGETADIFIGLDSLDDFIPASTTVLDNPVPSSEAPKIHVSGSGDAAHRHANPVNPAVDDPVSMSNISNISLQPESSASQDPLTGADPIVATNYNITDNENLESEELLAYPCLEDLDMSKFTSSSGQRIGKFQPKLKMQSHRRRNDTDIQNVNVAEPVDYEQDTPSVPPRVDVVDPRSGPAFIQDDVTDFSSIELSNAAPQSTSEVLADEPPMDGVGVSHQEAGIPGENLETVPEIPGKLVSRRANVGKGKVNGASDYSKEQAFTSNETTAAGRVLRKRKNATNAHKLRDESEDEDHEDDNVPAESLSNSVVNEDDIANDEFQVDDEPRQKKVRNKSKKPECEKDKPIRKRKKDTESSGQATKAAPKKFSHRTQRRKVDKALLETPEDEIDFRKVPLRDLVLLAEHKEQTKKKEAKASQAQLQNQRNGNQTVDGIENEAANTFDPFGEDETFASARDEVNDEEERDRGDESPSYINYQTYMDKTPRSRWSKQDTELFYQAVRQFGTDLSMIQNLFPGKTRRQIKLKYKKEERQHPLRLREAMSNPAKDHSHFELVIERLKQIAAEENRNNSRANSVSLTGEEEMEEETPEADVHLVVEEAAKSEKIDEAAAAAMDDENMKPDVEETQSPVEEANESDDDFWFQYKSEL